MSTQLICASHSPLLYCYEKEPQDWEGLQKSFKARAEAIEAFDPELIIAFGADHFNGFFLKTMPAFCVGLQAEAAGDIGGFAGPLDVPETLATQCVESLRDQDVDAAVSYKMVVDHAFSQTLHVMSGSLMARPTIPVFINCITTPFVPFRRSRMLGAAVGRFVKGLNKRVLLLASGGMSHHPTRYYPEHGTGEEAVEAWKLSGGDDPKSLTPSQWIERLDVMHHEGAAMIARGERGPKDMRLNAESDQRFLDVLSRNTLEEYDHWDQYKLVEEGGIGSMELHTWIAAAAAHREAGGNAPVTDFYTVAPEIGIAAGIVYAN
ncbi:DODA-type extradiol aromatic ring-opening family dioxygenase [Porticoccus sp. GXU_MW_L64]